MFSFRNFYLSLFKNFIIKTWLSLEIEISGNLFFKKKKKKKRENFNMFVNRIYKFDKVFRF